MMQLHGVVYIILPVQMSRWISVFFFTATEYPAGSISKPSFVDRWFVNEDDKRYLIYIRCVIHPWQYPILATARCVLCASED